ncbi:MAG: hypothetical protein JW944_02365 [Deltaproteobacteria bacterium]|nr:hypothetical protein [Deltaproteobacteria bacterium]
MAISGKYGHINIPGIRNDEPVFILRAQDKLAQGSIEIYKIIAGSHNSRLANQLDEEIQRFRIWDGPKKIPD